MTKRKPSRGMDLNSPLGEQPWYVKAAVWVGVPSVAFGYLLWVFVQDVQGGMKSMREAMDAQQKAMAGLVSHLQTESDQAWVQLGALQRICLNTSKTEQDRINCVTLSRTK